MSPLASNLTPEKIAAERVEAIDAPSPCPGACLWCGARIKRDRKYCSSSCRVSFNNWLTVKAKPIMLRLLTWRSTRGRKGTAGAGMISEIARLTDSAMSETHRRHKAAKEPAQ